MRRVSRSALVPYSAEQMYVLVEDVESYPDFLPWCGDAVLHWRDGDVLEGSVEMHLAGLRRSFRTRATGCASMKRSTWNSSKARSAT